VLRDERSKTQTETTSDKHRNFIISAIVFWDKNTRRSKQFAFVDFNTEDAAEICIKKWNNSSMKKYPNRLNVSKYEKEHVKMTKTEREKSQQRSEFTNLYVEKLPWAFKESDILNLFSKYGTVLQVKLKKPESNVKL